MDGTGTIRVFLLDDHEVVRRGVRDMLEAEPDFEVAGEAGSVEEPSTGSPWSRSMSPSSMCALQTAAVSSCAASCAPPTRRWPA